MLDRRMLIKSIAATGIGTAVFHRAAAAAMVSADEITVDSIRQAEWISDLELTEEQREEILGNVKRTASSLADVRQFSIDASVPMAIHFAPTAERPTVDELNRTGSPSVTEPIELPTSDEAIAFLPVHQLAALVKSRKLTSVRLTEIYLARLKKYAPMLRCVVTLTEELALKQAAAADKELDAGEYRGPLHGIPWGAKDLIAVKGFPTTWGIPYLKERELEETATVAQRLEAAGAVLVAKLSLGALAQGDKWFEGMTRSPWNPKIGSSGSSAGSAAASVAGLVAFALGSETLGSIVSPSIRCGASSLRPTFGRVSRDGCMPLCWSLDKIGPICRSVEDCALVFDAIHGFDGRDPTARSFAFQWPVEHDWSQTKVGFVKSARRPEEEREDLKFARELGCELVEIELPKDTPVWPLTTIINIEAASVFDEWLRAGHTEGWNTWDESFRDAQYVSAVDYVKIQRTRSVLMKRFGEVIAQVDFLINANDLVHTNLTGHPQVVMPVSYRERNDVKRPVPVVITGHLNDDDRLLAFASAYQAKLTAHQARPELDSWLARFNDGTLDQVAEPNVAPQEKSAAESKVEPSAEPKKSAGDDGKGGR